MAEPEYLTYAEFGEQFFVLAVTEARVLRAVGSLGGRPIDFGPVGVGPVGLVKVSAHGSVGEPVVSPKEGKHVGFALTIPVQLQMLVDLGVDKQRFSADVVVRLALTARAARPLSIVIDIEQPTRRNVDVSLKSDGLRASLLRMVAGIDGEVRKVVANYVRRELETPAIQQARVIDVAAIVAGGMSS
jgi:hypothetical protein